MAKVKIDNSTTIHVSKYSLPQFISSLKNSRQGMVHCGPNGSLTHFYQQKVYIEFLSI